MATKLGKIAGLLALAALSLATQAAEITLFEHGGFGGRQISLRDYTPKLSDVGFNDTASSIVVRSRRWEVCSDADFRGYCAILERGEYRNLDQNFNDSISSAREVGSTGPVTPVDNGSNNSRGHGAIELFGQPGFRGRSVRLDRDASNLDGSGFNDSASSLVVNEGTWLLCSDAGYQGNCRTYTPGRYPDLGYGMSRSISSARLMPRRDERRPVHGGGWGEQRSDDNARVVLYADDGLRGRSIAVSGNVIDLGPTGFNDAGASLQIQSGYWEFCSDSHFRGQCRVFGPGRYRSLEPALYRTISSIRVASGQPAVVNRALAARADIELFSATNFDGDRFSARQDLPNLSSVGFNDRTSSLIVYAGQWELCTDDGFSGRCSVFGPGRYAGMGGLSNQISSLRRVE